MNVQQNRVAATSKSGTLEQAMRHLLFLFICAIGTAVSTLPATPSIATSVEDPTPAFKYDGPGDTACLHDPSRICPSTQTLIANGQPVDVPTLPPAGLLIMGLLIAGTAAYTLNKQQKQQASGRGGSNSGGDGAGKPGQAIP